jgi:hypothetical protein
MRAQDPIAASVLADGAIQRRRPHLLHLGQQAAPVASPDDAVGHC